MNRAVPATLAMLILVAVIACTLTIIESDGYDSNEKHIMISTDVYAAGLHFKTYDDIYENTIDLRVNNTTISVEYELTNLMYKNTVDDPQDRFLVGFDSTISYDETFQITDVEKGRSVSYVTYVHQCESRVEKVDHWVYLDLDQLQKDTGSKTFKITATAEHKTSLIKTHIYYADELKEETTEYPQNINQFWFYETAGYGVPDHITVTSNGKTMVEGTDYSYAKRTVYGPELKTMGGAAQQDLDVYARFYKTYHQIIFDTSGGSTPMDPVNVGENEEYTLPNYTGTKTGYDFSGWKIDGVTYQPGSKITMGKSDITATAVWKKAEHLLKFNVAGGSQTLKDWSVPEGEKCTLPDYYGEKEGFRFGGWTIDGTTYSAGSEYTMGTTDVEAVAIWNADQPGLPIELIAICIIGLIAVVLAVILLKRRSSNN